MIFNKLRVIKKPNVEKLIQFIYLFVSDLDDFFYNGCHFRTAFVHPNFPSKKTTLYKILRKNHISIINNVHPSNIVKIYFDDSTFSKNNNFYNFEVNHKATNISKIHVDIIHQQVFGYSTIIDPTRHHGKGLMKSNLNAKHDGVEIQFPISSKEEDKIYQIIIDNSENEWFVDYRVCVIGNEIPLVYLKYKTQENRYTNEVGKAIIASNNLIPEEIQKKIIIFCAKLGCNFCELDILRDKSSLQWYVVDVNKTPYGPPFNLSNNEKKKAIQILSKSFYKHFLKNT